MRTDMAEMQVRLASVRESAVRSSLLLVCFFLQRSRPTSVGACAYWDYIC